MSLSDNNTKSFTALKGNTNYEVWSLRMISYLTIKGCNRIISSDNADEKANNNALLYIRMYLKDGPLLQI